MATAEIIKQLKAVSGDIESIDPDKLLRPMLGEASLKSIFEPKLEQIQRKVKFVNEYCPAVHNNHLSPIVSILQQIRDQLNAQSQRNNPQYLAQSEEFIRIIGSLMDDLQAHWPPFVTTAVEARGFLQDEGIRQEYQNAVSSMREEANTTLREVKEQAEKTIAEARKLAQEIEERARRTATHISVKEAQDQFREAQKEHDKQVTLWSWLSTLSVGCFVTFAIYLYNVQLPSNGTADVIYHTAVRLTLLTAIGAIAAFCLRVLRAHMHMRQHNLHRQRVANSMSAFVESAVNPDQRDLILAQLIEAIVSFGNSGLLLQGEDSLVPARVAIESITRSLSSSGSRS